jgi:hypothetical protein
MGKKWQTRLKWVAGVLFLLLALIFGYLFWIDRRGQKMKEEADQDTLNRYPNFKFSEFDSPALASEVADPDVATYRKGTRFYLAGSGEQHMDRTFLDMLQAARTTAGVPFVINSGYRTPEYNATLPNSVPNSSHILGKAADVRITPENKLKIARALYAAGFRRFGFGKNYIHVDNDSAKSVAIWNYDGATMYSFEQLA